jgi:SAM-dependent methyltransferase
LAAFILSDLYPHFSLLLLLFRLLFLLCLLAAPNPPLRLLPIAATAFADVEGWCDIVKEWRGDPLAKVQLYDGSRIPFDDNTFDLAMCITVLHHIPDNEASLRELRRVAKRVVVIEDLTVNTVNRYFTYFFDSLCNNDWFKSPPHTNRSDPEWRSLFQRLGFSCAHSHYSVLTDPLRRSWPTLTWELTWKTVEVVNSTYLLLKD